jgi:hypothetical protein
VEPRVNTTRDVADINAGRGISGRTSNGTPTVTVNGRTYGVEPNGTLYPIRGDGFIGPVDRATHKTLGIYNEHNGRSPLTEQILDRQKVPQSIRDEALRIFNIGRGQ